MDNPLMPELQDILQRIRAFNKLHPEGIFVYSFIGFKENGEEFCEECQENHPLEFDENKSIIGAFGHLYDLRYSLNMLRDLVEDNIDEDGFVSSGNIDNNNI